MEDCLKNDKRKATIFNIIAYIFVAFLFFAMVLTVILVMIFNDDRILDKNSSAPKNASATVIF